MDINNITVPPSKRISFDPTINLGHILTALSMMAVGFAGYNNLDKRISAQEQLAEVTAVQRLEQNADAKERLNEIKSDMKDMKRSIDDLTRALRK